MKPRSPLVSAAIFVVALASVAAMIAVLSLSLGIVPATPAPTQPPAKPSASPTRGAAAAPVVTSTADGGAGSLRAAIAGANPGDTIHFAANVSGTITLTGGQLVITKNLTIAGPGAAALAVSGNHAGRVFNVTAGNVTISGLTIRDGLLATGASGGGIYNSGSLTLSNSIVLSNTAALDGGGLYDLSGDVLIENSLFLSNTANSTGGAIWVQGGRMSLNSSTLAANTATSYQGGAIVNAGAVLIISNSTLSGNRTLGNDVKSGGAALEQHGDSPSTIIFNSTIVSNTSALGSSGLWIASGSLTMRNSIVANGDGGNFTPADGVNFTSLGHNLSNGPLPAAPAAGDLSDTNPLLGPLADNGGPLPTHTLLPGSPAVNGGDNHGCPPSDERGTARPQGGVCDIGAFEEVFPNALYLPLIAR